MRTLLFPTIAAIAMAGAQAAEPQVLNLATDFATTWEATQNLPTAERVAVFKRKVATRYPEFYGVERYDGRRTQAEQDELIGHYIEHFDKIRPAYLAKVSKFGSEMPRHIKTFSTSFPGFELTTPTFLVHSLGEMDGGTRELNGKLHLIFGADIMTKVHGDGDEAAFFHHELFHTHHSKQLSCDTKAMWYPLWREGLATYVSHVLNPKASEAELLLEVPNGMAAATRAVLPAAWSQLGQVLDNPDRAMYAELFQFGGKPRELPLRRGYYLGYLVAKEAGKTRDLASLAALDCDQVKALVVSTVAQMQRDKVQ